MAKLPVGSGMLRNQFTMRADCVVCTWCATDTKACDGQVSVQVPINMGT